MESINKEEFLANLRLTQSYCEQQLRNTEKNNASILRSINPVCDGKPIFRFKLEQYGVGPSYYFIAEWTIDPYKNANGFSFSELFQQQLIVKKQLNLPSSGEMPDGEILVSEFDESVTDGAPEAESSGLLDIYDCPPIDTWFYELKRGGCRIFFAWIPRPFIEAANGSVEVCCVDNIHWFKEWSPSEYEAILGSE